MNATDPTTCPSKFDEFFGVCNRLVFWTGTYTGPAPLSIGSADGIAEKKNAQSSAENVGGGISMSIVSSAIVFMLL